MIEPSASASYETSHLGYSPFAAMAGLWPIAWFVPFIIFSPSSLLNVLVVAVGLAPALLWVIGTIAGPKRMRWFYRRPGSCTFSQSGVDWISQVLGTPFPKVHRDWESISGLESRGLNIAAIGRDGSANRLPSDLLRLRPIGVAEDWTFAQALVAYRPTAYVLTDPIRWGQPAGARQREPHEPASLVEPKPLSSAQRLVGLAPWPIAILLRVISAGGALAYLFNRGRYSKYAVDKPIFLFWAGFLAFLVFVLVSQVQNAANNPSPLPVTFATAATGSLPAGRSWILIEGRVEAPSLAAASKNGPTDRVYVLVDPASGRGLLVLSPQPIGVPGTIVSLPGQLDEPPATILNPMTPWLPWAAASEPGVSIIPDRFLGAFDSPVSGVDSLVWAVALWIVCVWTVLGWRVGYVAFQRTPDGQNSSPSLGPLGSTYVQVSGVVPDETGGVARVREVSGRIRPPSVESSSATFVLATGSLGTLDVQRGRVTRIEPGNVYPFSGARTALRLVMNGKALVLSFNSVEDRERVLHALRAANPDALGSVAPIR